MTFEVVYKNKTHQITFSGDLTIVRQQIQKVANIPDENFELVDSDNSQVLVPENKYYVRFKPTLTNPNFSDPYCSYCFKTLKKQCHLEIHLRSHTGQRPFGCEKCGKTFKAKHHLKNHLDTHSGERTFECHICNKTYQRKERLIIHIRMHTGEKPYDCEICGKTFSDNSNLNAHRKIHKSDGKKHGKELKVYKK